MTIDFSVTLAKLKEKSGSKKHHIHFLCFGGLQVYLRTNTGLGRNAK